MTNKEILKFQKIAIGIAIKKGYGDLAEDFSQDLMLKWLEGKGKNQNINHALIDYLRSSYGRKGTAKNKSSEVKFEEFHECSYDPFKEPLVDWELFMRKLTEGEKDLVRLRYEEEFSSEEIAEMKKCSPPRISQMLRSIREKLEVFMEKNSY